MADAETERRINNLNLDLLDTLASLGEFVIAQNAALIELATLVSDDRKARGDLGSLQELSRALHDVTKGSHDYVKTLRVSVTKLQHSMGGGSDA
jgi:hypothetical protein